MKKCLLHIRQKKCFLGFSWLDVLVVFISSVAFLMLLLQNSPIASDDMIYRFDQRSVDGAEQWTTPITNFSELIDSNVEGYLYGNGRFLVHCFAQLILSFGGYWILYVVSPILLALFLFSALYVLRRNTRRLKGDSIYLLAAIITFVPLAASTLYGAVTMMVNYMWSMAIYTAFLATYFHITDTNDQHRPLYLNILLLLWGVLCGSWQESFCIGIAGAIAIYHLIHIRQFKGSLAWLVIGFGIGAAILVFAPGNFARMDNIEGEVAHNASFVHQSIQLFIQHPFVWLWIAVGALSLIIDYVKSKRVIFLSDNWLWFGCSAIALTFTLFTLHKGMMQGTWQLTILGLTDAILLVRFLSQYCCDWMNAKARYIIGLTSIYLIVLLSTIFYYRDIVKQERDAFDAAFVAEKPDIIYDGRLQYAITEVVPSHPFLFEKICDIHWDWYTLKTLQRLSRYYTNAQDTWGTDILPEPVDSIIARCTIDNQIGNDVYRAPWGYLIVVCPNDADGQLHVHTASKFSLDKLKDKLKHRAIKDIDYTISGLRMVNQDVEQAYYICYPTRWVYYSKHIVGVDVELQNAEE